MDAAVPVSNIVGMLISGRPVTTEFYAVSDDKLVANVEAPGAVSEISFFLMPDYVPAPDQGLVIYYSTDGVEWSTLGALHAGKPSATFITRWSANPALAAAPMVQIGVSVEGADTVQSVVSLESAAEWDKLSFAQLVARDLFNFLGSFSTSVPGMGERLVLPTDALNKWLAKFEDRFRRDGPNFLAKYAS